MVMRSHIPSRRRTLTDWETYCAQKVSGLAPAYLKDLLSGMAVLNKGGPMKHQWTLQKDFVYTAEAADTEGGAAMQ